MEFSYPDPIRKTRKLFLQGRREIDCEKILNIARDLRSLGRPDLGLELLSTAPVKIEISEEITLEKIFCLKSAGFNSEALRLLSSLKQRQHLSLSTLLLGLKLLLESGIQTVPEAVLKELLGSVRTNSDFRLVFENLPLSLITWSCLPSLLAAAINWGPKISLLVLFSYVYTRVKIFLAKLVTSLVNGLLCLVTGRKEIIYSSMGRFTRLADLIDQVDSLLRKLKSEGRSDDVKVFIFFFGGYPNQRIFKMYKQFCTFIPAVARVPRKLAFYAIKILKLAGRYTEITVDYRKINQYFLSEPPIIGFGSRESRRLHKDLNRLGIDPSKPFICMGLRDMAYYQFYGEVMNTPLVEQGKRSETDHRCPPLETYLEFAKYWASRGYQVIRMGLRVSSPLATQGHPLIIDYASAERSDELDAFLLSRCWFLTAGDTGLFSGAAAFDRPSVVSDLFLIRNTIYSSNKMTRNIFVPKLIYDEGDQRFLSFREQIHFNHNFSYSSDCESAGFKIVHNAPDDIVDASLELVDRLSGNYRSSPEDDALQSQFHQVYLPDHVGYASTGIVSSQFLRKYSYLLE